MMLIYNAVEMLFKNGTLDFRSSLSSIALKRLLIALSTEDTAINSLILLFSIAQWIKFNWILIQIREIKLYRCMKVDLT